MGTGYNPLELHVRANRAIAQGSGLPQACVVQTFNATNAATATLPAGTYLVYATADCWINVNAAASAGNVMFIPGAAKSLIPITVPTAGTTAINVVQASAGGTLYLTRMDDVA